MEEQKNETTSAVSTDDTTPKVTGIGGIFFFSDDPKETRQWYAQNLGLEINEYSSSSFEFRDIDKPEEIGSLQWCPFKKGSDYFAPSKKEFMINYRVDNLGEMIAQLREGGVEIIRGPESHENGRFAWILDPEGNKVELWEPMTWDEKNKTA